MHEQVDVIGFAVEFAQLGTEIGTAFGHDFRAAVKQMEVGGN